MAKWFDSTCEQLEHWIKSVLITCFVKEDAWVFEVNSGDGSEIGKWQRAKIQQLTAADKDENNLIKLLDRSIRKRYTALPFTLKCDISTERIDWSNIEAMPTFNIPENFLTDESLPKLLPNVTDQPHMGRYDSVACFTGLAFHHEETALTLIKNVSDLLKEGGFFFGIMPDSSVLFTKAHNQQTVNGVVKGEDYEIAFPNGNVTEFFQDYFQPKPITFRAFTEPNKEVKEASLYLVHCPTLIKICAQNNLAMIEIQNLAEFYEENRKLHENNLKKILGTLKVHGKHTLRLGFYTMFAFQKRPVSFREH